jgi:hypothetical protein
MFSGDPWADNTRPAYGAPQARQELRGRPLAANDKSTNMPDAAREHMARALQADDDPESRLARFTIATSDPEYMRAFSKWFADPISGHREWDARELAAWQKVRANLVRWHSGRPVRAARLCRTSSILRSSLQAPAA